MTQEEIIEGNKLIAEFMGAEKQQWYPENKVAKQSGVHYSFPKDEYPNNERYHSETLLKYHTSWEWLMPVVEKIESLGYYTNILSADNNNKKHTMHITLLGEYEMYTFWHDNKINAVWLAVVEFINTQTPHP